MNQTAYYNQTQDLNFRVLAITNSQIDSPAQDQTYDSNQNLVIIVEYNNTELGTRISTATVQWRLQGITAYSASGVTFVAGTGWQITIDLSSYAGQTVTVTFDFDTDDDFLNSGEGIYIDDIMLFHAC